MRSPKQLQASRANGAKSKGPVTPQGKRNSSRNATRHGLLAETIVLETEHADRFLKLLNDLFEEHQPSTPTQIMLVETIAAARWRQSRIWGMQKVAFDHDVASIDTDPGSPALRAVLALRGSVESIRTHELLLRYEAALDRQISRSLLRLHQLQERRIAAQESAKSAPRPHSVSGSQQETAAEERTQQAIEKVTRGSQSGSNTQSGSDPHNQTFEPNPSLPIPPRKQDSDLPLTARGKFRLARRK
jgi:hypothetical protein